MVRPKKQTRRISKKHHHSTYRAKKVPVRLAHHTHTGRRLPFYCTSYAVLFFLIAFTCLAILYVSKSVVAEVKQGSISLSGSIKGNPPEVAAKITSPQNGTRFTTSQIKVEGTCLQDKYVEIYRKNIFAGATVCTSEGLFKIIITIVPGQNELVARTKDSDDQYGPNSETINVFLDSANSEAPGTTSGGGTTPGLRSPRSTAQRITAQNLAPLLIYTSSVQRGINVNQQVVLDYEINGDKPPYTISIEWDDGTPASLFTHHKDGDFSATHIMKEAGQRLVRINALGAGGGTASVQTIIVVEGAETNPASTNNCTAASAGCAAANEIEEFINRLWLPIIIALLMTLSFWLGEKFMYTRLRPRHSH